MAHISRPAGCKVSIGRMVDAAPAALGFLNTVSMNLSSYYTFAIKKLFD